MNILEKIKKEKEEIIEPFLLFNELSQLVNEPLDMIATIFSRLYTSSIADKDTSYNFYRYDKVDGAKKIYRENLIANDPLLFIDDIARGAELIIFGDNEAVPYGWWGLSWNGVIDRDNYGDYNCYKPFYFKRSEIKDFLITNKMPLPPCIIVDCGNLTPINDDIKEPIQDNSELLRRIKHLEVELAEQKKINDDFVEVPYYKTIEAASKALCNSNNSQSNIINISSSEIDSNELSNLKKAYRQLQQENESLNKQLDLANKKIEELENIISNEHENEELSSRERNNLYTLIGGLLFLLLSDKKNNRNQSGIIHQLEDIFSLSRRTLEQRFPQAKQVLLDKGFNFEERQKELLTNSNSKGI